MKICQLIADNATFQFSSQISTDGVAVTILYSKVQPPTTNQADKPPTTVTDKAVGVDQGKRNIFTMRDELIQRIMSH